MRLMLIGGRSQNPDNYKIESRMLGFYKSPKVLLFPTASCDSQKSINNLKNLFDKFDCEYKYALLFSQSYDEVKKLIDWADILYFAGGNTDVLVGKMKETGFDSVIKSTDKMLVGVSAGAIMMAEYGMGDSYSYQDNNHVYNYKMVRGLGLLNITFCPHYEAEDLYVFNDHIKIYNLDAYALEGDTALLFDDGKMEVIKSDKRRSAYYFEKELGYKMTSLYENKKIAALGPVGTFCDVACKDYLNKNGLKLDISYFPSIRKTIEAIDEIGIAVLPFENSLDGYVYETIDNLIKYDYKIVDEISERVEFAFVSNARDIKDVKHVFAQFKAKAECLDFLTVKNSFDIITTESNMISLESLEGHDASYGAIIPIHKADDVNYNLVIKNISDSENNYTRFVVVKKKSDDMPSANITCSLCIHMLEDHPGMLFNALKIFDSYGINLNAILSRPTKEGLGKYYFYIEISAGKSDISSIDKCILEIEKDKRYVVTRMGAYPKR